MGVSMIRSVLNWLLYEWGYARSIVGNEGGFIHKKLLGIGRTLVGAVVPGAAAITSVVESLAGRTQQKQIGLSAKFGPETFGQPAQPVRPSTIVATRPRMVHPQDQGPCLPGLIRGPQGRCIAPTSPLGAKILVGEAVMGKYGAALIPGSQIIDRAVCLVGMQLGDDGLCYNRGNITNKQRMWPAGRKPLLTGGEMNAIRTAARAGRRLAGATKRLQGLGMMPKPAAPRRRKAHAHAKPIAAVSV